MNMLGLGIPVVLLVLGLTRTTCQRGGERQLSTPGIAPVPALDLPAPPTPRKRGDGSAGDPL